MNEWRITDAPLINEGRRYAVPAKIFSKCGWSPFAGETFRSSNAKTFAIPTFAWLAGKLDENSRARRQELHR